MNGRVQSVEILDKDPTAEVRLTTDPPVKIGTARAQSLYSISLPLFHMS